MLPCKRQFLTYFCFVLIILAVLNPGRIEADSLVPTTVEITVSCGNGFIEEAEVCDPGEPLQGVSQAIGTTTCDRYNDIYGHPYLQGIVGCMADCTDYTATGCYNCGNGYKEVAEDCDQSDFGSKTCMSYGFVSGSLYCTEQCHVSVSNCVAMAAEGGTPGGGTHGGGSGATTGYNPGTDVKTETKVTVKGKSYPNSDVHILVDGKVTGIVAADSKADFYFETTELPAGVASLGFWSEDKAGLKSTLLTLTLRVISGTVTSISGVFIAPTIDIDKESVRQGEAINIFGQTIPQTTVNVHINSETEHIVQADSNEAGNWNINFDTTPLEENFHTAKANFQLNVGGNIIKSGFSKSVSFAISKLGGEAVCKEADLNGDGRVNLTDFSILLFNWGSANACSDQNQNGKVDLIDFSIMMYYWTG